MKWEPWEWHKDKAPMKIEIDGPPCANCKFWNPRITTTSYGEYDGVVLCTAEDMEHDFSCFKPKAGG